MKKNIFCITLSIFVMLSLIHIPVTAQDLIKTVDFSERIASDGRTAAVIDGNHELWMWGGSYGAKPQQVMSDAAYVTLGGEGRTQYAVIKTDGTLWMWDEWSDKPTEPTMTDVRGVWVASGVQLVLKIDKTLWKYDNIAGGNSPEQLMTDVVSAYVIENEIVALTENGTVWEWYDYDYKGPQKAQNTMTNANAVFSTGGMGSYRVFQMKDGSLTIGKNTYILDVASFDVSKDRLVVVKTDNTLWEWTFGKGEIAQTLTDVAAASTSSEHTTIIKKDGTLWLAGDKEWGMSGLGYNRQWSQPEQVLDNVIYATAAHSKFISDMQAYNLILAVKSDGSVWSWGNNASGQVGNGGAYDAGDEDNNYVKSPYEIKDINMFGNTLSDDSTVVVDEAVSKADIEQTIKPSEKTDAAGSDNTNIAVLSGVGVLVLVTSVGGIAWYRKRKK